MAFTTQESRLVGK